MQNIPATPCHTEAYPAWQAIKPAIQTITEEWAHTISEIIIKRCRKKIALYESQQHLFKKDYYKKRCIDYPIEKNKRYIAALEEAESKQA
ncbi:MAG: hypothetical protein ACTTH7_10065 [Treponema sp.]